MGLRINGLNTKYKQSERQKTQRNEMPNHKHIAPDGFILMFTHFIMICNTILCPLPLSLRYHMQMTPKTSHQLPGNKAPPAPLVQKAINADPDDRSVQHSRNASSSSELSGVGAGRTSLPALAKSPHSPTATQPQQQPTPPPPSSAASLSVPPATKPVSPTGTSRAAVEPQPTTPTPDGGATAEP